MKAHAHGNTSVTSSLALSKKDRPEMGRRQAVRIMTAAAFGLLTFPRLSWTATASEMNQRQICWTANEKEVEKIKIDLKSNDLEIKTEQEKGGPVAIIVGVVLLPELARAIYNLWMDITSYGTVVKITGSTIVITKDPGLPGHLILVTSKEGTKIYNKHQGLDAAKLIELIK